MARTKKEKTGKIPDWAHRLKAARIRTGKNQSEFARACGMSQQRYNHYENGKQQPDLEGIEMLSRVLNEEIYFVITGKPPRSRDRSD